MSKLAAPALALVAALAVSCNRPSTPVERARPEARSYASFEEYVVASVIRSTPAPAEAEVLTIATTADRRVACGTVRISPEVVVNFVQSESHRRAAPDEPRAALGMKYDRKAARWVSSQLVASRIEQFCSFVRLGPVRRLSNIEEQVSDTNGR